VDVGSVVVIDDDQAICDVVRLALEDDGYRVVCSTEPSTALATVLEERPDLVTIDWHMHSTDGTPLFDALRANAQTSETPVLICTTDWKIKEQPDDVVGPKTQVLLKPFELDELIEAVRRMTGRQLTTRC
jgi:DNA-binding response OmpR family regulator